MKTRALLVTLISLVLVASSIAQRRGNPGMQGGGQGQGAMGGQQRQAQGAQGSGIRTRDQQRLRIHATDQQRQQLRTCTQSAERIRKQMRDMSRISGKGPMTREQAQQFREQLRNEVQTMNQNHERLMAGFTGEQKTAARATVEQMEQSRTQLQRASDQLGATLNAPELDRERIRERVRDTERAANQLRRDQATLSSQFNAVE